MLGRGRGGRGDGQGFWDLARAIVRRAPRPGAQGLGLYGEFRVACVGPDGRVRWRDTAPNMVVTAGLNAVLEIVFRGQAVSAPWYMGLVDQANFGTAPGFPNGFYPADVMGAHQGWVENTNWLIGTATTRPAWSPAGAVSGSITNTSVVSFGMQATVNIMGIFIVSTNDRTNPGAGILFSEAKFSGGYQSVNNGDSLQCTYSLTATSTTTS